MQVVLYTAYRMAVSRHAESCCLFCARPPSLQTKQTATATVEQRTDHRSQSNDARALSRNGQSANRNAQRHCIFADCIAAKVIDHTTRHDTTRHDDTTARCKAMCFCATATPMDQLHGTCRVEKSGGDGMRRLLLGGGCERPGVSGKRTDVRLHRTARKARTVRSCLDSKPFHHTVFNLSLETTIKRKRSSFVLLMELRLQRWR